MQDRLAEAEGREAEQFTAHEDGKREDTALHREQSAKDCRPATECERTDITSTS